MKKTFFLATLVIVTGMCILFACKKNQPSPAASEAIASKNPSLRVNAVQCNFITLSGDITSNTTLSASNVYKLSGCVTVKSGVTLNIPAGTIVQGIKATSKAFLIVERGGVLNISGTSGNPVIFTSDQAAGSRAPGDWGGIRIFGKANNNNANALQVDLNCAIYTGGGTANTDNSGTMEYFQIHFAGAAANSNDISLAGIMLNSVGAGTTIDHVQVSNSINDGITTFGGTVKETYVVSYNAGRTDFPISYGYQGNMQFLAAMRLNSTATPALPAYGLEITNQITGSSTSTPLTQPIISNVTVLGPNHCSSSTVATNFKAAVHFTLNGAGKINNGVFDAWNSPTASPAPGLLIDDANSIIQTASNNLDFSNNSFSNSGSPAYSTNGVPWTSGCTTSMAAWITGAGTSTCKESGNQFSVATLGYDSSFCNDFCASGFTSNFVLGSTSLLSPSYTWDTGGAFNHVTYRGAFGSTDFTQGWSNWCAQSTNYCL
jgi:hypothetical protein